MSKLLVAVVVAVAALALGAVAFRPRPVPPVPPPAPAVPRTTAPMFYAEPRAEQVFGHLSYTPAQSAALVEAGAAILIGKQPTKTLSAASLEQLRQVRTTFEGIPCTSSGPCTDYRRDVIECLDEAGELVRLQLRKIEPVERRLFIAAMGVSVVTREIPYQRPASLAEFCRKLTLAREKFRPGPRTG